jgi:hypothetical protein
MDALRPRRTTGADETACAMRALATLPLEALASGDAIGRFAAAYEPWAPAGVRAGPRGTVAAGPTARPGKP